MTLPDDIREKIRPLVLLALDVDGVLTDGRILLSSSGEESKAFHIRDGLGIVMAQQAGLKIALVSGRQSAAVNRRARELGIPEELNIRSARDKRRTLRDLRERLGLAKEAVGFVGDDLNDLPAFTEAGFAAVPADAAPDVRSRADHVSPFNGGMGAAREIIETILKGQGRWEAALQAYLDFLRRDDAGSAQ